MKKYLIFLFVMFFASQAFSQQEEKKDTGAVKIDSIAKEVAAIPVRADSLTKDTVAKPETVAQPAKVDSIAKDTLAKSVKVDSLSKNTHAQPAKADSITKVADTVAVHKKAQPVAVQVASPSVSLKDTIAALKLEILQLREKISKLTADDDVREKLINELKQLKVLFDSEILTRTEFDLLKLKVLEKMQ